MRFVVLSDQFPQVRQGREYSIDRVVDAMVWLVGIAHCVPLSAGRVVEVGEQVEDNLFVAVEYELVERTVVYRNAPGSRELKVVTEIGSRAVDRYTKSSREIVNVSDEVVRYG